jgi:hypothetical protein
VSSLLQHERKLTVVHTKLARNPTVLEPMASKKDYIVNIGFRREVINPIFSRIYAQNTKTKYVKNIKDNSYYSCSFYYNNIYPPAPVLLF